jgi:hypothetical protein
VKFTVSAIAQLAQAIYTPAASKWDLMLTGPRYGNSTVGCLIDSAAKVIIPACQGTRPGIDFLKDIAAALPNSYGLPYGFDLGMWAIYQRLLQICGPGWTIILTGHSLGAAQAAILHDLFRKGGLVPSAAVLLACPRCVALGGPNIFSFANQGDLVPDVPECFPEPTTPICFNLPPAGLLDNPLFRHEVAHYVQEASILGLQFDALPARSINAMTNTTVSPPVTAAPVPPETFAEHLADIGHFLLSLFQTAAKTEQAALPAETAAADVAEAASGNAALIPLTNEAAGALGTVNITTAVTPASAADALNKLGVVLNQAQAVATAATGKPPSVNVTAALTGIAVVAAALPPAPVPAS